MLLELTLSIEQAKAEALSDALLEAGAMSVTIEDAEAQTAAEQALFGEPGLEPVERAWKLNRVRVMTAATEADAMLAAARAAFADTLPPIETRTEVADTDWVQATQSQFPPISIGARLWIVPSWCEVPVADAVVIRLDPGVAFGTGAHPTTRMCLHWLTQHDVHAARVLDYGCGSGILAIAAAKLGATEVTGWDIDAQALAAARANSATNQVAARYTEPSTQPASTYDLVLANILSNPLKLLAPALLAQLAPRGALVLSGILERQAEDLISTYASLDPHLRLAVWAREEGWVCLAGYRGADGSAEG